jgi:putative addiction module CopG family antidote
VAIRRDDRQNAVVGSWKAGRRCWWLTSKGTLSGLYNNASEVIREGLRLLKEHDEVRLRWRQQIERGWQQARAGEAADAPPRFAKSRSV